MNFHLSKHIYIAKFNGDMICLDILHDKYILFESEKAVALEFIIQNEFVIHNNEYRLFLENDHKVVNDLNKLIKDLRKARILDNFDHNCPYNYSFDISTKFVGAPNLDWRLSPGDLKTKIASKLVLEAFFTLLFVTLSIKIKGFLWLINKIKKNSKHEHVESSNNDNISKLALALNKACFYFPTKTKCLEWSATLVLMGLKRRLKCNLVVAVQSLPFFAHAWVESNGMVIADTPELPKQLAIILSEPYGRS